jgi:hypothetical protein|tara:strand:- start:640 stop:1101 length:462 start_codon:yes stop_codon:yes gene_type:complete
MKKIFLKKLQSLTAILVLNTVPIGFTQASVGYEAEVLQARVLSDDRRSTLKGVGVKLDPLNQLYLDNSLAYIQKHAQQPTNYQHQVALALVEEAYQDDFDALLDQYEHELNVVASNDPVQTKVLKDWVEEELQGLKNMRDSKIAEFNQQFGIT